MTRFVYINLFLKVLANPSELATTKMGVASLFVREDIPAGLISIEKTLIKCFFIELKFNQSVSMP